MSTAAKIGVVFLNLVVAAIVVAAIKYGELCLSGFVCVIVACTLWEMTRE